MINPNDITTVRVGQLPEAVFSETDNLPHEVGTELKRGTIGGLATFIANIIETSTSVAFLPITVLDGQTIPATTGNQWFLAGKGTFHQSGGFPDIVCAEELNAIVGNGTNWSIGVEIPIVVDPPESMVTQLILPGFTAYAPSSNAVYEALLTKEDIINKISEITGYSEVLYPNEKATHDALDMKLNISDLPSNLIFYATTAVAGIGGYFKLVDNIDDIDYDEPAVDVTTGTITTTEQLISSLVSEPGLLIGNPGIINITTVGNIKRISGTGTANFYFKAFHRDVAGVETLVGTSNNTETVTSSVYEQFSSTLLWNDGDFIVTDRIVLKFYANRISGGLNPVYNFQFGGATPVRTIVPVPFFIVAGEYELKANKQNSLTTDPTNFKYPTVTAVIDGLAAKQNTLTNPITGTGTTNYVARFTGANALGNSQIFDDGTNVGFRTSTFLLDYKLHMYGRTLIEGSILSVSVNAVAFGLGYITKLTPIYGAKAGQLSFGGENGIGNVISGFNYGLGTQLYDGTENPVATLTNTRFLINTTTDNGVDKLQVNGSILGTALKLSATPTISAGTYDVLTRNISSGAVERVLISSIIRPYKVYTALLSQTGTTAPTAIVLENSIGGTVVWTRNTVGVYTGTLSSAFIANKTALFNNVNYANTLIFNNNTTSSVTIETRDVSSNIDGALNNTSIEIRVYN